jgi:ParB family chromosome partitioning protein
MEVELHQLDLRYEKLRAQRPWLERRLLASLAEVGQQVPVVLVRSEQPNRFVLVDGYKRVRALRRLAQDTVRALCWDLDEAEALVLDRLMRTGESLTALEQGWLLKELSQRFDLSLEELGRRFDRSKSWVSRRLSLVKELPEEIQERVRRGELLAHAAMKYLVPLARANRMACLSVVEGIAGQGLTTRQVGVLYEAWRDGGTETRERLVAAPMLFLRAWEEMDSVGSREEGQTLIGDFDCIGAVACRSVRRLGEGVWRRLLPPEREEVQGCFRRAQGEVERLAHRLRKEEANARSADSADDPDS